MAIDEDDIRRTLIARREQLVARYQGTIDRINEELDTREIEQVENATELWDARLLTAMSDTDARALEAVVGALVRLDEGRYGECVDCGEPIDEARLRAIPEAMRCAPCAEHAEVAATATLPPLA
jgi:DnaK suppressor protein